MPTSTRKKRTDVGVCPYVVIINKLYNRRECIYAFRLKYGKSKPLPYEVKGVQNANV